MLVEIKVPSVGESVTEALLAQWFKNDGDTVKKDDPLFVIETDKVTLEVVAEADGILTIKVAEGETVAIDSIVGTIDTQAAPKADDAPQAPEPTEKKEPEVVPAASRSEKAPKSKVDVQEPVTTSRTPEPLAAEKPAARRTDTERLAPSVRRLITEKNIDLSQIVGTGPGNRITRGDVLLFLESGKSPANGDRQARASIPKATGEAEALQATPPESITRKPMSPIRRRIAARLLEAKQNTAMLTTFNEIDMAAVMAIRRRYKEIFKQKYGVNLGLMSFFIKASIEALRQFPQINSFFDDQDIIEHHYYHIGVAVGSERGLVVPVIRHADRLSFAELELAIVAYVKKIDGNRLELSDLEGGTFTISNGGVYGSLLSTPILNTPQSAILGMHKIEKRPVVIEDEMVIRPMMYVALSYDHRIVDGREAVSFLKRIKECIENPERMMMEI